MRSKRIGHLSARHVDASTFVALDFRREEEEKEEGQKGRREGVQGLSFKPLHPFLKHLYCQCE